MIGRLAIALLFVAVMGMSAFAVPASADSTLHPWAQWDMETAMPNVDISAFTYIDHCFWLRANQGVAYDGTYFYTGHLDKLDASCNLVLTREALADIPGAAQLNSVYYNPTNQHLYVGANNYPSVPRYGWIWEGYASNLTHIATHPVEAYWNEGACYANGYYWAVYDYAQIVTQFTTDWHFVADYSLDFWGAVGNSIFGYQGCRWHGDYLYLTIHENGQPDDLYMHAYHWTGSRFDMYQKIRSPCANCTQGFEIYGTRAYFSERFGDGGTSDYIATAAITFGGNSPDMYSDLSGNGHNIWSHNTTLSGGHPGLGQYFNGINSSARWEANSYMEIAGDADASGWATMSVSLTERSVFTYGQILAAKHSSGSNGEWFVKIDDAAHWRFMIINTDGVRVDSVCAVGISDGDWHQVLATYDGAKMRTYTDGSACTTTNQTGAIKKTGLPLRVGGFIGDMTTFNFQGTIDNVTLWKNQVVDLTNLGNASIPPPPVIVPPIQPIHDFLQFMVPFFGSADLAGFIIGFFVIVLIYVLLVVLLSDKIIEGYSAIIPMIIGVVIDVGLGFWPLWTPLFILVMLVGLRVFFHSGKDD